MEFTVLERAVIDWIAVHADCVAIREQLANCRPLERELSGVGSFTKVAVEGATARIDKEKVQYPIRGPWIIASKGIEDGGGGLLFVSEAGFIETLELYANGNHFEVSVVDFTLKEPVEPGAAPSGGSVAAQAASKPQPSRHR